jgi:hypothetical protein
MEKYFDNTIQELPQEMKKIKSVSTPNVEISSVQHRR